MFALLKVCKSLLLHSETAVCFLPTFALSLAKTYLTYLGRDMSGVIALAAALKDSKITHLKYVWPSSASHALCFLRYGTERRLSHHLLAFHIYSALHSLAGNDLCGVGCDGEADFTLEGLTPLCEALTKMPNLVSLKCAAHESDLARYPHLLAFCAASEALAVSAQARK